MADFAFEVVGGIQLDPATPFEKEDEVTVNGSVRRTDNGTAAEFAFSWLLGETSVGPTSKETVAPSETVNLPSHKFNLNDQTAGVYSIQITAGQGDAVTITGENTKEVFKPAGTVATDSGSDSPATDPTNLVWDAEFASSTGLMFVLITIGLTVVTAIVAQRQPIGNLEAFGVILGFWIGSILLLLGGWIVLLEMRGRAPRVPGEAPSLASKGLASLLEKVNLTDFTKAFRSMRGVLAVILSGLGIVILSLLIAGWDTLTSGDTDSTSTTSTTVESTTAST